MKKPPHIYVIGAGLIGLSTADALVAKGAKVTILEKRSGPGQGASFCNSGMIHPSQAMPWLKGDYLRDAHHVLRLSQRSKVLLQSRMEALGLEDATREPGCVQLFDSVYIGEQVRAEHELLGDRCECVSGAPFTFGRYALQFPDDGSGDAFAYCLAIEQHLVKVGNKFRYGVSEAEIENAFSDSDPVVVAAGLGSVKLFANLGIDLPLYPERGFALNFEKPDVDLPDMPIMHHASRSALTVFEDHIRLSGTVGEDNADSLIEIWEEIAPEIIDTLGDPILSWQENRPMSRLGRPIICHVKDNIWINAGQGHMGWTLSAGSGELMAEMVLEGREDERFRFIS